MGQIKRALLAAVLALPAPSIIAAEDMENVIVTGTYTPVQPSNLSSSYTILDEEFLRSTNKRTVADVLRTVPGLLIEETGGPGGLTAASIRGGEANFTLVLVDGIEVNDPTNTRGGSFDFSNLDMASIERIEIVRGPQSAVYGSGAMAGVVNIITRRSTEKHLQRVTAEWGQDDFRHYAVGATGSAGELGYSVQLAKLDTGEPTEGSERNNDNANLALDWSPSEAQQLQLNYRYLDGNRKSFPEQSGGSEYAILRDLDQDDYTDNTLGAGWGWQIMPDWHSELSASRYDLDEDFSSPGIYPFDSVPPQRSKTKFTRDQYRWVNDLRFWDIVNVAAGADYRNEEGDSTGDLDFGILLPTDFSLDRSTKGLFLESHARVLEPLLLQGSVRYDDPEDFNSQTTRKLGAKYNVLPQLSFEANWGEAFKLPSFAALGHALVGNPFLLPETGKSWDFGLEFTPSNEIVLNAAYFSNDYKDLIDFDSEQFRFVNRQSVDTNGVELQLNWLPITALNVLAHTTYTDIDLKDPGAAPLLSRPNWTAGATALWQISPSWHAALDYQWTGEQYGSSRHTGDTVVETLDNFHQLGANLAWQVLEWVSVELAVDNMLDENYHTAVGFPGPGRSVRIALTLTNI